MKIKFRAWDKTIPDSMFYFPPIPIVHAWMRILQDPDNYEIMQFTGLKDKNGKEIYEGDILNWTGKRSKDTSKFAYRYIIIFEDGIFGYRLGNAQVNKTEPLQGLVELETYEVIGNIYENPKLLTQPK